jgi:hypothetical protein
MPILVANVLNGPDTALNTGWNDVITRGVASGKTVLGYVRTGYLGVSQQQFTTRLGVHIPDSYKSLFVYSRHLLVSSFKNTEIHPLCIKIFLEKPPNKANADFSFYLVSWPI